MALQRLSNRAQLLVALLSLPLAAATPPSPTWPHHFSATFDVYMRFAGPFWKSKGGGAVQYSASAPHTMHSYYFDYCPPMFDNVTSPFDFNFTCEFLFYGSNSTVYYLNPDGQDPHHPPCCVFAVGLDPPAQDFCATCTYVTNTSLHGTTAQWWAQGDTGFTYANYVTDDHAPASLWASLAPNVGVLQVDYTSFNDTAPLPPDAFKLPPQCAAATTCADVAGARECAAVATVAVPGIVAPRVRSTTRGAAVPM